MPLTVDDLLFGPASSDEDFAGDSNSSDDDSDSDADSGEFSAAAVVNLASPSAGVSQTLADDDDDDVQILTPAEAAAEVAAAARRAIEDPNAGRKRKRPLVETKPEPTECTICCEDCTMAGRHRLAALKCGHLFGKKCIERWVSEKRTCPNCSAVVRRADICLLYSDHVAVVDNSGLEDMTSKYEAEKEKCTKMEKEMQTLKQQLEAKTNEAMRVNAELAKYKKAMINLRCHMQQMSANATMTPTNSNGQAVANAAGVRVPASVPVGQAIMSATQSNTAFSSQPNSAQRDLARGLHTAVLTSSQTSPARSNDSFVAAIDKYKPVFDVPLSSARVFVISPSCVYLCIGEKLAQDSYGIIFLSAEDPRRRIPIHVHSSDVRDMSIHSGGAIVLTTAFDGKLAVTNLRDKKVAMRLELPSGRRQGWSCSFSETDPYAVYCGFQDGSVAKYDMRKTGGSQAIVRTFSLPERQPVHSIKLFQSAGTEGLAAATFRGLSVWRNTAGVATNANELVGNGSAPCSHVPSDQACYSLASNQQNSSQVVVSSRSIPAKHSVYYLSTVGVGLIAPHVEFVAHKAPSVLSRSAMWSEANGTAVVASWSQDTERVTLWNVSNHRETRAPEPSALSATSATIPVVDIQHTVKNGNWSSGVALLGTMSSRQLCMYRSGV
ncbi:unnamed protein product [Phytophthora lilii]|uniref:RING-type E3 ubiquitin transferase n=1 Tax=Phytophthora lilii TaxID=2077276 RepID=A0A9W6WNS8_9STRA|nr:unnamed protein product [Phytophthora lilii]